MMARKPVSVLKRSFLHFYKDGLMRLKELSMAGLVALAFMSGCSSSEFETAVVSGTVRCDGVLLTEGLVIFTPVPSGDAKTANTGRAASGIVWPDGTYELSTFGDGDGAIVGDHDVEVYAPALEDDDAPLTDANRYACGKVVLRKTVAAGTNVLDLELSRPAAGKFR
jgi:hypothetical protein